VEGVFSFFKLADCLLLPFETKFYTAKKQGFNGFPVTNISDLVFLSVNKHLTENDYLIEGYIHCIRPQYNVKE
jgi:hypothetical protein